MPQFRIPPLFYLLLFFFSCTQKKEPVVENTTVEGSWDRVKYIDYDNDQQWAIKGDSILYQKHITPNSFVWMNFDKKNEQLIGMGGGTYDFTDGQYTEYIAFFYPPVTSIIGQPIPFSVEFKDGQWIHIGYFIDETIDPISGEIVQRDSVKIHEIWERTKEPVNDKKDLIGTWQLLKYRGNAEDDYIEFPDYVGSIKLITDTHFTWIQYDKSGEEVYAMGSGTYTYDDDAYTEEIHVIYPENTGQIGESIPFSYKVNDNQWYHYGFVPQVRIDSGKIVKDSLLIDEYWGPFHISSVNELLL
ncbi:MAG: hypothetical protein ACFHWX_11125 [Bacteroidota bacterium]